ncbi:glycosyltransferase family 2 protein [Mycetocola reblochoni]|uniref:Glycosyltransferase family 2 protein n=2 Tax=Mycetocola reblochoni TaxID=331618 RepID=A0A3L6ZM26_9MICO|nr:glycosyltransferase family 2 protein [Mycetocola reblochoni]RLP68959.1 glycosyltransferase family 2 protein [Mycetocola reblochoni]SJN18807.1 putative glycosyltransferase [Mycetocola reblochoni REB411]
MTNDATSRSDPAGPGRSRPEVTSAAAEWAPTATRAPLTDRQPAAGAVVVVNYGSSALLKSMLAPLGEGFDGLVVVVDNDSGSAERSAVTALGHRHGWEVVALPDNRGFGAGVNRGVARARELGACEFLILNPDARLDPDDCARLLGRVREADSLLLSPRIVRDDGRVWFDGSVLDLADGRVGSRHRTTPGAVVAPWLSGACLAVDDALWGRLGGFDEDYFLYWEDVDLSWRARGLGAELRVAEDITAVHLVGATQQASGKSALYYRCNARNRSLFALKNLSATQRADWAAHTGQVVREIMLRGGRRQFVRDPRRLLTWMRAWRDARAVDRAASAGQVPPLP